MTRKANNAALAERERLTAELLTCRRSRADASRAGAGAEKDIEKANGRYQAALADAARGKPGAEESVAATKQQLADLRSKRAELADRAAAATSAGKQAERRLRQLHGTSPEPFIAEAQALTDEAVAARQRAVAALEAAQATDSIARKAWQPLIDAARTVAADGQTRFGGKSLRELGPMPPPVKPLDGKAAGELRAAPPPSPAGIRDPQRYARVLPGPVRRLLGVAEPIAESSASESDWKVVERVEHSGGKTTVWSGSVEIAPWVCRGRDPDPKGARP